MSGHNWFWAIMLLDLLLVSCGGRTDLGDDDIMRNLIATHTTDMARTASLGTAAGGLPMVGVISQRTSLQQDKLEPGEYTLQFQVIPPSDGNGFACYAIVNWKVAGQQITRKLSVFSGAAISGVAEAVDVTIIDVSGIGTSGYPPASPGNPADAQYKVAVNLARGTRANTQQPPILLTQLDALELPKGGSIDYLVPDNAGVISAMVLSAPNRAADTAGSLQDITVQQVMTGGLPAQFYYPATQPGGWIPITPLVTSLSVGNKNSVDDAPLGNVIWGIEG